MDFHNVAPDFVKYFDVEEKSMPATGYAYINEANFLRPRAIKVILQNSKSNKRNAYIPYLALNYFDRFISKHTLPEVLGNVEDDLVLAANCCLIIAWKLRDQSFSFSDFMARKNLPRNYSKHALNMELQILNGLEWRSRAVVAVNFVPFFLNISSAKGIKRRHVNRIIIEAQADLSFASCKPSVIAAAALVHVCKLLLRDENGERPDAKRCRESLIDSTYVDEDSLDSCCTMLDHMCCRKKMFQEINEEFLSDVGGFHVLLNLDDAQQLWSLYDFKEWWWVIATQTAKDSEPSQSAERSHAGESSFSFPRPPQLAQRSHAAEFSSSSPWSHQVALRSHAGGASSSSPFRPGEQPTEEITETLEEPEDETVLGADSEISSSFSRRPGKQPMEEGSEADIETPSSLPDRQGIQTMQGEPEADPGTSMDFELRWDLDIDETRLTIDSSLFRPPTARTGRRRLFSFPISSCWHRKRSIRSKNKEQ